MAKGRKTGGRKKGTPNKVTSTARAVFLLAFGKLEAELEKWIRETAEGVEAVHFLADGTAIPYIEKNPGKAADLLIRMAEYHFPKLGRQEHVGEGGGPIQTEIVIRDLRRERESKGA